MTDSRLTAQPVNAKPSQVLHREAFALAAFRAPPGGGAREYTTVVNETSPRGAILRTLHQAQLIGYITMPGQAAEPYAMLDVKNAQDDTVQEFPIPTSRAFRWWRRRLGLTVVSEDKPQ